MAIVNAYFRQNNTKMFSNVILETYQKAKNRLSKSAFLAFFDYRICTDKQNITKLNRIFISGEALLIHLQDCVWEVDLHYMVVKKCGLLYSFRIVLFLLDLILRVLSSSY